MAEMIEIGHAIWNAIHEAPGTSANTGKLVRTDKRALFIDVLITQEENVFIANYIRKCYKIYISKYNYILVIPKYINKELI